VSGSVAAFARYLRAAMEAGPFSGFHINKVSKTRVLVRPEHLEEATETFRDLPVNISTCGELLGGFVGNADSTRAHVDGKVQEVLRSIAGLTEMSREDPQNAPSFWPFSVSALALG
jgi:hypothetical protein